ncbi:hypothetical protein GGH17_002085 [Coemansia sp. RSA 788]|nr:hypothetical protein GGH17_002085 [Coemansia sp. RSA 788]KAJ2282042.1 hypothetical protein GGH14_001803 [Coemansia sp. RSA 370]KAJ2435568.1 hypothetical protein IWW41_000802 [Coemansia sp. RSA 2522]
MTTEIKRIVLYGGNKLSMMFYLGIRKYFPHLYITVVYLYTGFINIPDPIAENAWAKISYIKYGDYDTLEAVFQGNDAIICTLDSKDTRYQIGLINTAEAAGIKVLVPAHYGIDVDTPILSKYSQRVDIRKIYRALKKSSLKYIIVAAGFSVEDFLAPHFGWDFANNSVLIHGDGTSVNSFTPIADLVRYTVAAVLRIDEFHGRKLRIATYTLSVLDWVAAVEAATGQKFLVRHQKQHPPLRDLKKTNGMSVAWWRAKCEMINILDQGGGLVDWSPHPLDNSLLPEVVPTPINEIIQKAYSLAHK